MMRHEQTIPTFQRVVLAFQRVILANIIGGGLWFALGIRPIIDDVEQNAIDAVMIATTSTRGSMDALTLGQPPHLHSYIIFILITLFLIYFL